jgi:hypothetical protein
MLALRDDAFRAELAWVTEHDRSILIEVFIQSDARPCTRDHAGKRSLAHLQRIAPEVVSVQLDQVERVKEYGVVIVPVPNPVEGCDST